MIERELSELGPDVLAEGFEPSEMLRRARTCGADPIAQVLLHQGVVAGIGNVYKSELLFLAGVHPANPVSAVSDESLVEIAERAASLLRVNVRAGPRSTTGERARLRTTWVYGRAGLPCRRCGSAIRQELIAGRVTYSCPTCQPESLSS